MDDSDNRDRPSNIALQKAAQAWCGEKTSCIEMNTELAVEFARILDLYIDALIWCSGSDDFAKGGKAENGWKKVAERLLQ